jgi:two-component system sensor histidine kinase ChiS
MTIRNRTLLITAIYILILVCIRLGWTAVYTPPPQPKIIQGQLDLRGWDITSSRPILLDGQWEFHPNQWIYKEHSGDVASTPSSSFIAVPGNWSGSMPTGVYNNSAFGYGTYRLRILINPLKDQIYSLRFNSVSSSAELFVNGQMIAQSGQTAERADTYTPYNAPFTASFVANSPEIEIVVQVANFHHRLTGGIDHLITFGTQSAVFRETTFSIGNQLAVCIILLLHAAYACILYAFGIRERAILYLVMMFISAIFSVLIVDDKLLLAWLPINFNWELKINNWAYLGSSLFWLLYAKALIAPAEAKKLIRWFIGIIAGYSIFVLFGSAEIILYLDILNVLIVIIPFLIVPVMAWRAMMRGEVDAIYIFLGTVSMMNNIIWGAVKMNGWFDTGFYPIDLIVSFIAFAAYWFKRYSRNSKQTAQLALELQKADKLKDDFLVNTSHELRNPLHGMLAIAQTMLNNEDNNRKNKREDMKLLINIGKRMTFLLDDLTNLTRLRENRIRLQLSSVSIQSVAPMILDMFRSAADSKSIQLINHIPESFPPVVADENRLVQIMFNLVHNAVKFTDSGSITLSAYQDHNIARIEVNDTGIGIDPSQLERIFQRYEQAQTDHASTSSGLGIGLSICQQLVELHGGMLKVSSTFGHGSTFSFTLPVSASIELHNRNTPMIAEEPNTSRQTANKSELETAQQVPTSKRHVILAVDDDPINLNILALALGEEEYEVITATNGEEALQMLQARDWDLVIADVMMPRMSGYELCAAIRTRFLASELPILLLTARVRTTDIEAGFNAGANDYVTKPVDIVELQTRVKSLISLRQAIQDKMLMEAALLQAQIQPHFLFNTLNSIVALSEFDLERMRALIDAFSSYLRSSFAYRSLDRLVPLEFELNLVRTYLYIEQERFGDRLQVVWEVNSINKLMIPPLSIQPIVENAVIHGLMRRKSGGEVRIIIEQHESFAAISIIDNGVGMNEETIQRALELPQHEDHGIGLSNTHRRLKQLFGEGLFIQSKLDQGTTTSFRIPH